MISAHRQPWRKDGLKLQLVLHFYITLRVIEYGAHQSGLCMFDHLSLKLQLKDEITVASYLVSPHTYLVCVASKIYTHNSSLQKYHVHSQIDHQALL